MVSVEEMVSDPDQTATGDSNYVVSEGEAMSAMDVLTAVCYQASSTMKAPTLKDACHDVLYAAEGLAMTVTQIAAEIQRLSTYDFKRCTTPKASVSGALSQDGRFIRVAKGTYELKNKTKSTPIPRISTKPKEHYEELGKNHGQVNYEVKSSQKARMGSLKTINTLHKRKKLEDFKQTSYRRELPYARSNFSECLKQNRYPLILPNLRHVNYVPAFNPNPNFFGNVYPGVPLILDPRGFHH